MSWQPFLAIGLTSTGTRLSGVLSNANTPIFALEVPLFLWTRECLQSVRKWERKTTRTW